MAAQGAKIRLSVVKQLKTSTERRSTFCIVT
jgi:hypothetical protein